MGLAHAQAVEGATDASIDASAFNLSTAGLQPYMHIGNSMSPSLA